MKERIDISITEQEKNINLQHVALIMDGNRRWARSRNLPLGVGYNQGRKCVEPIVRRAGDLGIEAVSFYALSLQNLQRPEEDLSDYLNALRAYRSSIDSLSKDDFKLHIIGNLNLLPNDIEEMFNEAEARTNKNTGIIVNLALGYGGRDEIARAFKKIADQGVNTEDITEKLIGDYLDTADQPDPDLVIRTGARSRLSGFYPWQSTYSELYFTNVMWPDFSVEEFDKAIEWYENQTRTFGQ